MAAIDVSGQNDRSGADLLEAADRRQEDAAGRLATYSMRAMHDRVSLPDATGNLAAHRPCLIWRSADVRGNNNSNAKGGTYFGNNMAVIKADKTGMSYVVPLTDMSQKLLGIDGTHLGFASAMFGTTDALKPGIVFLSGSHTGGGVGGTSARVVTFDRRPTRSRPVSRSPRARTTATSTRTTSATTPVTRAVTTPAWR